MFTACSSKQTVVLLKKEIRIPESIKSSEKKNNPIIFLSYNFNIKNNNASWNKDPLIVSIEPSDSLKIYAKDLFGFDVFDTTLYENAVESVFTIQESEKKGEFEVTYELPIFYFDEQSEKNYPTKDEIEKLEELATDCILIFFAGGKEISRINLNKY